MSNISDEKVGEVLDLLRSFVEQETKRNAEHEKEHEFLRQLMQEYQSRIEFWEAVKKKVATTGVLAVIGAIGSAIVFTAASYFKGL